mgnify:CR=1 FL=1
MAKPQLVKCRSCGKTIDKSDAYKVKRGRIYFYFCDQYHAREIVEQDAFVDLLKTIYPQMETHVALDRFKVLKEMYGYNLINHYITENMSYFRLLTTKNNFVSQYTFAAYMNKVLQDKLRNYKVENEVRIASEDPLDVVGIKIRPPKKSKRRGLYNV